MAELAPLLVHNRTRPRTRQIAQLLSRWRESLRDVVRAAAEFADSNEWAVTGAPTAAHWIAAAADVEVSTAREWIRTGLCLQSLPAIAAAFAAGTISYSKVRTLTRFADVDNEAELLAIAQRVPAGQIRQAVAAWLGHNTDDLTAYQRSQRSLTWRNEPDGMMSLHGRLEPLIAGGLIAALTATVMRRVNAPLDEPRPTLAQQYADAFAELITKDGGANYEVIIHVRGDGVSLDDGTPLPESVVERIAPNSTLRALIHDAAGRPINASGRQRHPSDRQRRVVRERDRACVDCGSTELLEYDHVPAFSETRRTLVDELQLHCAPCHRRRHRDTPACGTMEG